MLQVPNILQVEAGFEVAHILVVLIHVLLVLVARPIANLSSAITGDDQTTRTMLLVVSKHALVDITVREDVTSVTMHLMVLDLTFIDNTVGDDVATDAVNLTILNLTTKVRILRVVAKFELSVDVRVLRILNDIYQLECTNFVPLLTRFNACFIWLTLEE